MTRPELIEAMARAIYERVNGAGCRPWRQIDHKAAYRDQANAALAAIEAAGCVVVPGWRTMDSAPQDETTFLACNVNSAARIQAITWRGKVSHVPLYGWCWGEDGNDVDLWEPTHWMPLPAPPASPIAKDA